MEEEETTNNNKNLKKESNIWINESHTRARARTHAHACMIMSLCHYCFLYTYIIISKQIAWSLQIATTAHQKYCAPNIVKLTPDFRVQSPVQSPPSFLPSEGNKKIAHRETAGEKTQTPEA